MDISRRSSRWKGGGGDNSCGVQPARVRRNDRGWVLRRLRPSVGSSARGRIHAGLGHRFGAGRRARHERWHGFGILVRGHGQ